MEDKGLKAEKEKIIEAEENATAPVSEAVNPLKLFEDNINMISKGVSTKDEALFRRVLRRTHFIRMHFLSMIDEFQAIIVKILSSQSSSGASVIDPSVHKAFDILRSVAPVSTDMDIAAPTTPADESTTMEVESSSPQKKKNQSNGLSVSSSSFVEVELYIYLILSALLIQYKKAIIGNDENTKALIQLVDHMIKRSSASTSGRMVHIFLARAYQYWARVYELVGLHEDARKVLLAAHRTASLRSNEIGQATTINLILRNYSLCDMTDQAAKFSSRAPFPPNVSNNQQVRYLYYQGRFLAIQLEYSDSYGNLLQAIRKTNLQSHHGFRLALYKLATVVQLLMGESPDRAWFSDKKLKAALVPYYELVNAVRTGQVSAFESVREKHKDQFSKDKNYLLVCRLRSSVIKAGLRSINKSYSRISLQDIAEKLGLDSEESAESVCAKAIRDGVIDATLDEDNKCLCTNVSGDVYSTAEPQQAFHRRIKFLMTVHDDALKSMKYTDPRKRKNQSNDDDSKSNVEDLAEVVANALEDGDGDDTE